MLCILASGFYVSTRTFFLINKYNEKYLSKCVTSKKDNVLLPYITFFSVFRSWIGVIFPEKIPINSHMHQGCDH